MAFSFQGSRFIQAHRDVQTGRLVFMKPFPLPAGIEGNPNISSFLALSFGKVN
jgi:hypothetical protein